MQIPVRDRDAAIHVPFAQRQNGAQAQGADDTRILEFHMRRGRCSGAISGLGAIGPGDPQITLRDQTPQHRMQHSIPHETPPSSKACQLGPPILLTLNLPQCGRCTKSGGLLLDFPGRGRCIGA